MEPLSAIGSVLAAAATGAKLSLTLYELATSLGSTGKDVRRVAADFGTFAQVLRLAHNSLKNGTRFLQCSDVVSGAAELVDPLVDECKTIYKEADDLMESLKAINEEGSSVFRVSFIKIKRHFQKSRIEVLNGRLKNFQGTLQLLLTTIDLEMAIQDELPPDVIEVLENEKKSSIKMAEFQSQEMDQLLLEAKSKKEEASSLIPEGTMGLMSQCVWTPPKLDPKPQRAVMQLAFLGSDRFANTDGVSKTSGAFSDPPPAYNEQDSTPNTSLMSESNTKKSNSKLLVEAKQPSQSGPSKLETYESLHKSYVATYDYKSINQTHLNFTKGDVISNIGSPPMAWWSNAGISPSPAWLFGNLHGRRGAFPRDRVREYFED